MSAIKTLGFPILVALLCIWSASATRQQWGSIRGQILDGDFDIPLNMVRIEVLETGQAVETAEGGQFLIANLVPGRYTLLFSKEGYVREVRTDVVVRAGELTTIDLALAGDYYELDEFVVQDLVSATGAGETALLQLRFEAPALMNTIGADLMSRAGASDAAAALKLVAGASVQDGKYAVIRGLPDRYVSSQMNGVRLPTADEDKRAVQLDQFPAPVIDSIRVSKSFTPDQQGDASGGAVDLRLKGIPDAFTLDIKTQFSANTQVFGEDDFLTYEGGGVDTWGNSGGNPIQTENLGDNWDGAVGVSADDAPTDYKWSVASGGKHVFDSGTKVGGFLSFFYERDSAFFDDAIEDTYWVVNPGDPLTPETYQGEPDPEGLGDYRTGLFDVIQSQQEVKWGALGTLGLETDDHRIALTYLYTRSAEDIATLAEDTRGKEFFFPGYDPENPDHPGNQSDALFAAPYLRTETLEYTERTTGTLQLSGSNALPIEVAEFGNSISFERPELEWVVARSTADLYQPDKRQFGTAWLPIDPPLHIPYKPGANFTLGNLQRIWKDIAEDSDQYSLGLKLPFAQWNGRRGYVKAGYFDDSVKRAFNQDSFSNFADVGAQFEGEFDDLWSANFPFEDHAITASEFDVDYAGKLDVSAWYSMVDLPISKRISTIGGVRVESTDIGVVNTADEFATWFPPDATGLTELVPGAADVDFSQDDVLPSIALVLDPSDTFTVRLSYGKTVARQTFKELTPIIQQEFLGGPVFIGNPELQMSSLDNYDLRADYVPYEGGLWSASVFYKDIEDPIEYKQRIINFSFTTPVNYPKGKLSGIELEVRQDLERLSSALRGLGCGANATFIASEVTLPEDEAAEFEDPSILAPMYTRDMTNAPEHLYNLFLTYDVETTGTELALFYTIQGDTLVAGAGTANGYFVPNVYATEYDTLNFSLTQKLGKHFKLQLQAKNLTDPLIEEVYRYEQLGTDVTKTSYTKGVEFAIGLNFSM